MVAVGGGDVDLAVQAQEADGKAAQRRHHTRRVSRPDQRFVLLISHVPHPVKAVFDLLVAAGPGGQGGRAGIAVAGDEVDDFDSLLPVLRDRAAQLRDLGSALELDPGRRQNGLGGATGPASVIRAHGRHGGTADQGSFFSCRYNAGMLALTVISCASAASHTRSAGSYRIRPACRRSTAFSCRSASSSASLARSLRNTRTKRPSTRRTIK